MAANAEAGHHAVILTPNGQMKLIRNLTAFIMIVTLAAITFGQSGQIPNSAVPQEILGRQVRMTYPDRVTITYAFMRVLSDARVPGGLVTVSNCGEEVEHTLTPAGSSLRDVLDSIVSVAPLSRWQLEDGVVNLVPVKGEPPLLNLRLAEFNVKNATTVFDALNRLLTLPDVQKRMAELHVSEVRTEVGLTNLKQPGSGTNEDRQGFTVHCKSATVREALNAIVRAHGYAVWAYRERHCNGRADYRIDFLAR